MEKSIGIIGLGRVGITAARAYIKTGYTVFGFDIDEGSINSFRTLKGIVCRDPGEVMERTGIVLIMVLNDAQVKDVISGPGGILRKSGSGKIVVCMSTINRANLIEAAGDCFRKGIEFVDCPFTGGPARISSGSLTLIAAAPSGLIDKVRPVLEVVGHIVYAGEDPGLGQAVKHCNQLLVGSTHAATMEVITLARRMGLDPALVCDVVGSGIAGSDYFNLLSESVLAHTPSPGGLGQMCKDVSIVVNTTQEVGMKALVVRAASRYFQMAEKMNMQNREGADLIEVVEKISTDKQGN